MAFVSPTGFFPRVRRFCENNSEARARLKCHQRVRRKRRMQLQMAVYYLRPRTLSWVMPIVPSFSQLGVDGIDGVLCSMGMLALGLSAGVAFLPPLYVLAREIGANGKARAAPYAALLLGTLEHGYFHEGMRPPMPVGASPALHGVPAAALVLSSQPECDNIHNVAQVYVPDRDLWLMPSSRVHRSRMRQLVSNAHSTQSVNTATANASA